MLSSSSTEYRDSLLRYVTDFFTSVRFYERGELLPSRIKQFLSDRPAKDNAFAVYDAYLDTYRTPGLSILFERMREFEEQVAPTLPHHRDHYVHSVQTFLLGLAIYHRNQILREIATRAFTYQDSYPCPQEEFLYRWGLTALFHDIGYPVEIAYAAIQEYARLALVPAFDVTANSPEREAAPSTDHPVFSLAIENLDRLLYINQLWPQPTEEAAFLAKYPDFASYLGTDILLLLAGNLAWRFKVLEQESLARTLRDSLMRGMSQGCVDHGLLSAIILLKWVGTLHLRSKWNPAYFYFPVMDAAAGILLHNAYGYCLMRYPFNLEPLMPTTHVLGYLLSLCDHLQEAERQEYGFCAKHGNLSLRATSLSITDSALVLQFAANGPDDDYERLLDRVRSCEGSIRSVLALQHLFPDFHLDAVRAPTDD